MGHWRQQERTYETDQDARRGRRHRRRHDAPGPCRRHLRCRRDLPVSDYAKWADAYKKETGNGLNYQSIGSGGGIKQITARTVTFGASDMPLQPAELDKIGVVQFPTVMGGVVPVVNLEGVKSNDITLDGATVSKIFMGEIKSWDDAAIAKLNPKVKLPKQAIAVVHRSDGSGTTFIFTNYLSKVSADWKSKVGNNTAVEWPVGIGAKGNEGVANNVANTKGSIGYVETAYAKQNNLTTTNLVNHAGKAVAPTADTIMAAAGRRRLGQRAGLLHDLDQLGRRQVLADRGRHLHPRFRSSRRTGLPRRGAELLRLGLQERRQDGRGPRLHPDAGQRREADRGELEGRQGQLRQADLLIVFDKPGRRGDALSLST